MSNAAASADGPLLVTGARACVIAARVVETLRRCGSTLATSESLTGGLIGATLTSVPGASDVYVGGAVVYATRMKTVLSGVRASTLAMDGVISGATARELAVGIRECTGATWAVATTGVAGPDLQEGHAPGEVWIGLCGPDGVQATQFFFDGDRAAVRQQTVEAALTLVADAAGDGPEPSAKP